MAGASELACQVLRQGTQRHRPAEAKAVTIPVKAAEDAQKLAQHLHARQDVSSIASEQAVRQAGTRQDMQTPLTPYDWGRQLFLGPAMLKVWGMAGDTATVSSDPLAAVIDHVQGMAG